MRLSSTGQTSFNIMRGIMRTLAGWQRRRTRPAARGSSSHNPHYVWRPRVQPRSPCSAKLRWRSALLSAVVPFCGPAVTAIPGGSGAVLRRRHRGSACCKRLSAWRPPLKRLYARPASSGCGGSCRAKRPRVTRSRLASHRSPPWSVWSCKGKPRSGSGAAERRSVACGLSAARTRRPRAVAPPCRRRRPGGPPSRVAGNGLSGKRNDRFVTVVIW